MFCCSMLTLWVLFCMDVATRRVPLKRVKWPNVLHKGYIVIWLLGLRIHSRKTSTCYACSQWKILSAYVDLPPVSYHGCNKSFLKIQGASPFAPISYPLDNSLKRKKLVASQKNISTSSSKRHQLPAWGFSNVSFPSPYIFPLFCASLILLEWLNLWAMSAVNRINLPPTSLKQLLTAVL